LKAISPDTGASWAFGLFGIGGVQRGLRMRSVVELDG
jgi:hypothetical protein